METELKKWIRELIAENNRLEEYINECNNEARTDKKEIENICKQNNKKDRKIIELENKISVLETELNLERSKVKEILKDV